jgi:Alcohol dehydrogenase GroES-associated/Alcohol dehydrogenase GroES-like domain
MKAVVFHGKNDIRVEDVPVPKIQPGRVMVQHCRPISRHMLNDLGQATLLRNLRYRYVLFRPWEGSRLVSDIADLHEYLGGCNIVPDKGQPHALTGETVPVTFGHEFSGVVEEVGEGVKDYKVRRPRP